MLIFLDIITLILFVCLSIGFAFGIVMNIGHIMEDYARISREVDRYIRKIYYH